MTKKHPVSELVNCPAMFDGRSVVVYDVKRTPGIRDRVLKALATKQMEEQGIAGEVFDYNESGGIVVRFSLRGVGAIMAEVPEGLYIILL